MQLDVLCQLLHHNIATFTFQTAIFQWTWANYVLSFILKFLSNVGHAYWQSGRMQAKLSKDYKNDRWLLKKNSTLHKQHPKGQSCKVEAHPCHNHLWLMTNQMVYIQGQNFTLSSCKTIQLPNCSKKSWQHPNTVVHTQLMWAYIFCLSHAKSFEMAPSLGSSTIFVILGPWFWGWRERT